MSFVLAMDLRRDGVLEMSTRKMTVLSVRLQRDLVPAARDYIKYPHTILETKAKELLDKLSQSIILKAEAIPIPEGHGPGHVGLQKLRNSVVTEANILLSKLEVALRLCQVGVDHEHPEHPSGGHELAARYIRAMRHRRIVPLPATLQARIATEPLKTRSSQIAAEQTEQDRVQLQSILADFFSHPQSALRYNATLPKIRQASVRRPRKDLSDFFDTFFDPSSTPDPRDCDTDGCAYHVSLIFGECRVQPHRFAQLSPSNQAGFRARAYEYGFMP